MPQSWTESTLAPKGSQQLKAWIPSVGRSSRNGLNLGLTNRTTTARIRNLLKTTSLRYAKSL